MKIRKLISSLLLAAMLASMAACGGAPASDDTSSGDTTPAADTTLSEEDARLAIDDGLPEKDYEGYEFTIWSLGPATYYMEEETGDIVDDAKYQRQRTVEERFNVNMKVNETGWTWQNLQTNIQNSIMASDNAFDIAMPHQIGGGFALITNHMVIDWNEVPYVDLTKPWWNQRINETLNIQDHQFYIAGHISLPSPFCFFFNKQFVEDYNFEDMYTLVREGRWTIDKMLELTKTVSKDLNGDTKMEPLVDQWGCSFNFDNQTLNFMYAFDHMSVLVNEDGEPEPNTNNEQMLAIVEKVTTLIKEDNRTLFTDYNNQGELGGGSWRDGRVFLMAGGVGNAGSYRDLELDFGVIPYPKWDEDQKGYYSHVDASNGMLCVPVYAEDLERTGIIIEAYAAETYKQVMPVYYDKALGDKYMRDDDSIEMMDIIYGGIVYDFGYVFDTWMGCTWTLPYMIRDNTTDISAYWASVESKVTAHYDELYDAVLNYDE